MRPATTDALILSVLIAPFDVLIVFVNLPSPSPPNYNTNSAKPVKVVSPMYHLKENILSMESFKSDMKYKSKRIEYISNNFENVDDVKVLLNNKTNIKNNSKTNTIFKFIVSLLFIVFLVIYLLSIRYCNSNRQHCNEIYELTWEVFDDSMSSLNESYTNLVHQFERLS